MAGYKASFEKWGDSITAGKTYTGDHGGLLDVEEIAIENLIQRIIKPGGTAICFGWSSMGLGKSRGFEMTRVLLVPHGGSKNDTIVTVEKKNG